MKIATVVVMVGVSASAGTARAQDGRRVMEIGPMLMVAREQRIFAAVNDNQRVNLMGGRFGFRGGPVFLRGQYLEGELAASGSLPSRKVRLAEAGAGFVLAPEFRLDGAVFLREYETSAGRERWYGPKAGAGFQGTLWPGVIEVRAVGHYIPIVKYSGTDQSVDFAWDGEVELALRPSPIPARFAVGYRVERLDTVEQGSAAGDIRQLRTSGAYFLLQLSL